MYSGTFEMNLQGEYNFGSFTHGRKREISSDGWAKKQNKTKPQQKKQPKNPQHLGLEKASWVQWYIWRSRLGSAERRLWPSESGVLNWLGGTMRESWGSHTHVFLRWASYNLADYRVDSRGGKGRWGEVWEAVSVLEESNKMEVTAQSGWDGNGREEYKRLDLHAMWFSKNLRRRPQRVFQFIGLDDGKLVMLLMKSGSWRKN